MAKSRDYDELKYAWKTWRDNTGAKMKNLYKTYVDLSNEIAHINGKSFYNFGPVLFVYYILKGSRFAK